LSGWVGAAATQALVDALATEVLAETLHVDDTPVPVLAPRPGKTKTGRLWTYIRDERPSAGSQPPAALVLLFARKGEHPQAHLKRFRGVIHADGYAGFNELFVDGRIVEAGCWAHVRRTFFDVAPSSTQNAEKARDPEMHQTKKGNQWYFGMKAHFGVDSGTKLIHAVVAAPANVADAAILPNLLHSKENRVWAIRHTAASGR
jgi:hypothetical protein